MVVRGSFIANTKTRWVGYTLPGLRVTPSSGAFAEPSLKASEPPREIRMECVCVGASAEQVPRPFLVWRVLDVEPGRHAAERTPNRPRVAWLHRPWTGCVGEGAEPR